MVASKWERVDDRTLYVLMGDDWDIYRYSITRSKKESANGVTKLIIDCVPATDDFTADEWSDIDKLANMSSEDGADQIEYESDEPVENELDSVTTIEIRNVKTFGWRALYNVGVEILIIKSDEYSIGSSVFQDCTLLHTVQLSEGLREIEDNAFNGCMALNGIRLPHSLKSISLYAFADCIKLTAVNIPDGLRSLYTGAFANCRSLESVVIPASLKVLQAKVFYHCIGLKSVILPEGFIHLYNDCFRECMNLEEITLPESLSILGNDVFNSCLALRSITIPARTTNIGRRAFKNCVALATVELPTGLLRIELEAFRNCVVLTTITIPETVTFISLFAFVDCINLRTVIVRPGNPNITRNMFPHGADVSGLYVPVINDADMTGLIKGDGFVAGTIGSTNYLKGRVVKAANEERIRELELQSLEEHECNDIIDPITHEPLNDMEEGDTIIMNRGTRNCYAPNSLQGMITSNNAMEPTSRQPMTDDDKMFINTSTRMFVDHCL